MGKRPKSPRRRHVPGTFRSSERTTVQPGTESQRLTLYLPASVLDRAEAQALRGGFPSLQRYCEALLLRELEAERLRDEREDAEARRGRLEGLLAIANDPDYLAEWDASRRGRAGSIRPVPASDGAAPAGPDPDPIRVEPVVQRPAAEVVERHAGLLDDAPDAFLASLRRGTPIGPESARELMQALADLEAAHRGAAVLDRRLSYALHKLAFEGQVIVSESWAGPATDASTVDLLRLVQEAVDRVLSGQDIRYFSPDHPTAPADHGD